MFSFENSIIISVSVLSTIAALLSMVALWHTRNKNRQFQAKNGDVISPQRENVENIVYINSEPLTKDLGFLSDANHILFDPTSEKEMLCRTKLPDFSFFENMGINLPEVKVDEKTVMCLMPFNRRFEKTKNIIAEACKQAGYTFRRSDDELIADNTDLRKSIIRMILESEVIVAVLDGRNPNVFYEIGIAHSLGKLVLMVVNLSREENQWKEVDLLSNRLITYNNSQELKDKLTKTLKAIDSDGRIEKETNN